MKSSCLSLLSAGVANVCHEAQFSHLVFIQILTHLLKYYEYYRYSKWAKKYIKHYFLFSRHMSNVC